ncbi:MAG: hypothetical protein D6730_06150 [Bacteroidetes bacterium]|nr:MAG: hypothetical protein D6730_06150 [Bacteroidota bacterium]
MGDLATKNANKLRWPTGSAEQLEFMRLTYKISHRNSARRRTYTATIPSEELAEIEDGQKIKRAAAEACKRLLKDIRAKASSEGKAVKIGVKSAYRSVEQQLQIWQREFIRKYYPDTKEKRKSEFKDSGGEHGSKAARWLSNYIRRRLATPGFSKHQNGIAVDFSLIEGAKTYRANTSSRSVSSWKTTWFWQWMNMHASEYGFKQNHSIDEPWHWEYHP